MRTVGHMLALPGHSAGPGTLGAPFGAFNRGFGALPPGPRYTVQAGDTIARIAFRFRTTPAALVKLNPRKNAVVVMRGTTPDWRVLQVGEVLSVPGRRPNPAGLRRGQLSEDGCDPGFEIGPDGSCVFIDSGQPCGNGGVYDSYGQCQNENEAPPPDDSKVDVQKVNEIKASGIIDLAQDAANAGLTPGEFCASLTKPQRLALSLASSYFAFLGAFLAGITFGISAFVLGLIANTAQLCSTGDIYDIPDDDEETPPTDGFPDDEYKDGQDCNADGTMVYSAAKGRCVFYLTGQRCDKDDGTQGVYDDDGNCVYDAAMTQGNVSPCPPNPGGKPYTRFWNDKKTPPRWECILCPEGSAFDDKLKDCKCTTPGHVLKEVEPGLVRCVPESTPGKVITTGGGVTVPPEKKPVDKPTRAAPEKSSSKLPYVVGALAAAVAVAVILKKKKGLSMSAQASSLLAAAVSLVAGGMGAQLYQLLAYLAAQSGAAISATPLPRVLFVDNGFTGTSDGSIVAPFATIAAAIASPLFVDGTTLVIAPGTYPEAVNIPAARRNISLIGLGAVLIAAPAGVSLSYAPTGAYSASNPPRLAVDNIVIGGAAAGIGVNGTGLASTGASVVLNNVNDVSANGSELRFCTMIEILNGSFNSPVTVAASRQALISGAVFNHAAPGGGLTLDYDAPNAGIVTTHDGYTVANCNVALLRHLTEARVTCNKATTVGNYDATLGATNFGNDFSYAVIFQGRITALMALGTLPDANGLTQQPVIDLRSAVIASLTVNSADTVVGGRTINAQNSAIASLDAAGGSQTLNMNVRGGLRPPTLSFDANFRLDRDTVGIPDLAHPGGGAQAYAFLTDLPDEPAFPAAAGSYAAIVSTDAPLAAIGDVPAVTAKSASGFTITAAAAGTFDVALIRDPN